MLYFCVCFQNLGTKTSCKYLQSKSFIGLTLNVFSDLWIPWALTFQFYHFITSMRTFVIKSWNLCQYISKMFTLIASLSGILITLIEGHVNIKTRAKPILFSCIWNSNNLIFKLRNFYFGHNRWSYPCLYEELMLVGF